MEKHHEIMTDGIRPNVPLSGFHRVSGTFCINSMEISLWLWATGLRPTVYMGLYCWAVTPTFKEGQWREFHLGTLVSELGRAVRTSLPGPAHGAPGEAIDFLGIWYRKASGWRSRAGWRKFGVLHNYRSPPGCGTKLSIVQVTVFVVWSSCRIKTKCLRKTIKKTTKKKHYQTVSCS